MADVRSAEARSYRHLYNTARWRRTRADQLAAHPLCAMCAQAGRVTAATVCDHVHPHRGDETLFWAGPFQSLCSDHHDRAKQREEHAGYSARADDSGWPTDPRHPSNRRR